MNKVKNIIETQGGIDKFHWGLETVMHKLRPGCLYNLSVSEGKFVITDWPENQWSEVNQTYIEPPSSEEIHEEYIRQQTIADCLNYFKLFK